MKGESEILGLEAAGVVTSIDEGCAKHWTLGDKVMALLPGDNSLSTCQIACNITYPVG